MSVETQPGHSLDGGASEQPDSPRASLQTLGALLSETDWCNHLSPISRFLQLLSIIYFLCFSLYFDLSHFSLSSLWNPILPISSLWIGPHSLQPSAFTSWSFFLGNGCASVWWWEKLIYLLKVSAFRPWRVILFWLRGEEEENDNGREEWELRQASVLGTVLLWRDLRTKATPTRGNI